MTIIKKTAWSMMDKIIKSFFFNIRKTFKEINYI